MSRKPVYREILPPVELSDVVACCWIQRGDFTPATPPTLTRVLPDGCMDIMVTLGDFARPLDSEDQPTYRAFVVGTMTRQQVFALEGRVDMVAIRFKPGGARPFLRAPASELVDLAAPLEAFWGPAGANLPDRLYETEGDAARAKLLFDELIARRAHVDPADAIVQGASALIDGSFGTVTVDELRKALYVSERTLERRFRREVGVSPKQAARIARLQAATRKLTEDPSAPLGRVAHECGYYDQAHFNREFRMLAGVSPGEWRAKSLGSEESGQKEPD